MPPRDIVAIGGSAGSIEVLKAIVRGLPSDLPASIFVVIHVSPDSPSMLARMLSNSGPLSARNPLDQEQIRPGRIYVSRPDHHLTIEGGRIRVLRGPRENRHRPAIDALLRTAAREYGRRVVGVVLSGLQDDGSAGLYAVKQRGGITIVQDPQDAEWKDMPNHAIEYVHPDYVVPASGIAPLIVEFATPSEGAIAMPKKKNSMPRTSNGNDNKSKASLKAALDQPDVNEDVAYPDEGEGRPSVFACPECHGVLWELKDDKIVRFRCRVGHSYGTESLNQELSAASEAAMWAAVRALEEKAALQRRVAEGMGLLRSVSSRMLDQSTADAANARLIRDMIFRHDAELELEGIHSEKNLESPERKTA
ncbi:MAG TPA: chemotaxis protein CheB [Candidatus Sulfotelmatobacter sp.]|nr:chemotaxis protein CheB [Candidatus Sulfotelmatobacter sp.]